jgi:hypothetical protein
MGYWSVGAEQIKFIDRSLAKVEIKNEKRRNKKASKYKTTSNLQ